MKTDRHTTDHDAPIVGAHYADRRQGTRPPRSSAASGGGAHYGPKRSWTESVFAGDKALWVVIITLLIYSLFVVYSTTAYDPALNANQELTKQLLFIGIGMTGFFLMQSLHPRTYRPLIKLLYWASIALTVIMIVMYSGSNAARSLEIAGFDFQPFELLKVSVILLLADRLARRQKNIDKIDLLPSVRIRDWKENPQKQKLTILEHTLPVLGPVALACCITIIISNSTTFIIAISCLLMLFIGRIRGEDIKRLFILGIVVGIPVILILAGRLDTAGGRIAGYSPNLLRKSVQVESDGKEYYVRPDHELDQTMYAKMSIASGGLTGKGPGQSTNRYLQEADKDMAYAFLIEEYGLLFGGAIILLAFLIMFYRGMEIFRKCGTAFPGLAVLGLITAIVLQAFLHMMVSVSLLPVTGQQLPIVSKGGSSLVFTLASLGLVMGISARANNGTLDKKS
ncbi:MAG: FtsW/RodA/SpoVE family cell cycle protein [Tidjanibacter sp.]|nr:FtsW/RodA/SpoVE family cell cycle protein [Tidjanibacter sp.]